MFRQENNMRMCSPKVFLRRHLKLFDPVFVFGRLHIRPRGVLKTGARASHLGNCLPCPKRGDHVPTLPCRAPVRSWGGSGALHGQPQPHTHVTCIYIHELNACSLLALIVHYWPTAISTDWAHLDVFILFILDRCLVAGTKV
jgi:hypothetical protein